MIIFLFILFSLGTGALYLYYDKKVEMLKKQLMINRNKYSKIKSKYTANKSTNKNLSIKFTIPTYKSGSLKAQSKIYISPLYDSSILRNIESTIQVYILDCAEINNETWFYINLPENTSINCRGWVNSNNISIFYSTDYTN